MTELQFGMVPEYNRDYEAMSFRNGVTIVLNDAVKSRGILTKWHVNFVKENVVSLQIWRPVPGSASEFVSVLDQKVDSETIGLGDAMIPATQGIQLEANDRIGVAVQEGTLGIGYTPIQQAEKYQATSPYQDAGGAAGKKFSFETQEYKVKLFVSARYLPN